MKRKLRHIYSLLFVMCYGIYPLYTSNQHTYFLHGLAASDYGFLKNDWTAGTTDPFTLFSYLVKILYKYTNEFSFYILTAIIIYLFVYALSGIIRETYRTEISRYIFIGFVALFTAIYSLAVDLLSNEFLGINLSDLFQDGLANQYVLGHYVQPSSFGVLIIVSIYLFLRNKYYLSTILLVLTVYFHISYLIPSSFIFISYLYIIIYNINGKKYIIRLVLIYAFTLIPVILYNYVRFAPTSVEVNNLAETILYNYRIPQHANIYNWFGFKSVVKIALIITALFLNRNRKIYHVLLIPFLLGVIFSAVQLIMQSKFLALLFPWRISVILVPLSTALLIAELIQFISDKVKPSMMERWSNYALIILIYVSVIHSIQLFRQSNLSTLITYVKHSKTQEDVYLIPPYKFDFRLRTGARVFVDKKSNPYKDIQLVKWYNRLNLAQKFYNNKNQRCDILNSIVNRYEVNKIVTHYKLKCKRTYRIMHNSYYVYGYKSLN